MTDTLYLRLSNLDASAPVESYCTAADGSSVSEPSTSLAAAALAASNRRVVVLLPGDEALSTTARLPKMSAAKLRASLPFALEDQLAGEIDEQHFATARPLPFTNAQGESGIELPVVVMQRARLSDWLELLRGAGIEPSSLLLDDDCVAAKPGDVIVWLRRDEALIRTPSGNGLVTRIDNLADSLALLPTDIPPAMLGLQVYGGEQLRAQYQQSVEAAAEGYSRIAWISAEDSALPWLVAQIGLARPVELLQAEFAPRRQASGSLRKWRIAAALAGLLLIAHFADRWLSWQTAAATEAALDQQILQIARSARPDMTTIGAVMQLLDPPRGNSSAPASTSRLLTAVLGDLASSGAGNSALRSVSLEGPALKIEFIDATAATTAANDLARDGWQVLPGSGTEGQSSLTISGRAADPKP